jgi:hypothetical protein
VTIAAEALASGTRRRSRAAARGEVVAGVGLLALALVIGLVTARNYGVTIDEFNTEDYGPKALAWYTSGFTDRSHFETVEFGLWYYGPWAQILTTLVQSLGLADPLTIRHAVTFVIGLAGLAALLPMARLSVGAWAGPVALLLCLITGYVYGNLFFTPIDVPFLAAMSWATLAIMLMARGSVPTMPAAICAGLASGLAIATRTGGIITHAYLLAAMALCALEVGVVGGRAARPQLWAIALRTAMTVVIAWLTAVALWPWLQLGNPLVQFKTAYGHFTTFASDFVMAHWGTTVVSSDLPRSYLPAEWLARLPLGFVVLLVVAAMFGIANGVAWARTAFAHLRRDGPVGLRGPALRLARARRHLLVWMAALVPLAFLIIQRATLYNGVRHTLFVAPMLALIAGWGLLRLLPYLRRALVPAAALSGAYVAAVLANLVVLHPLEYVATNALAGGTAGSYGRFELDYWSAAATEGLRRLESRWMTARAFGATAPSVLVCIPWREGMTGTMLRKPWRLELDPSKADFVIETQSNRCLNGDPDFILIDQVERFDRTFAWVWANRHRSVSAALPPIGISSEAAIGRP